MESGSIGQISEPPEIAIIDDDVSFREALAGFLSACGYATSTFVSAIEFIKAKRASEFACIITDLKMPEMDGFELQEWLIAARTEVAVIFVTSTPSHETRSKALDLGAVDVLAKPFDREYLLRGLREVLNRRR